MQERVGSGVYNTKTTKVLHFIRNPEAEAVKELQSSQMANLAAENEALRAQIERTGGGEGAGSVETAVLQAEIAVLKRKVHDLPIWPPILHQAFANECRAVEGTRLLTAKHIPQVAELDKQLRRLKEVFSKQITAFREACYQLFGYRVDMAAEPPSSRAGSSSTFVLRPQHMEDGEQVLMFRFSREGMELLPNDFTDKQLYREVETFITK